MQMTPIQYNSFIESAYTDCAIISVPPNALYVCDNCVTSYKLGAILKRPGYVNIGAALQANKSITGLHNFRQTAATQKMLATINDATDDDTQLFYSTGGAWTEIGAAETAWANKASINVEFADFIGYSFIVGYGATDGFLPVGTLTGTTYATTNTTNMPSAKYIVRYRDRLYIANCDITGTAYPYRVYFSSVPSGSTISWTVATDFLDVDYSEGITGLSTNWDRLIAFTEYSMYFYNQIEWKKMYQTGCANHRNICNYGQYMIWANMDNVWVSTGGMPQPIGGRVIDFIRNANVTNSFASVVDGEYHLYLGNVTVNGVTYGNCAIIYNFATGTWRWHEYYDTMTISAPFYATGKEHLWMGANDGDVHELGKYTDTTLISSDDGQPIHAWFQTGALSLGDPSTMKKLGKIMAYSDRAQGLLLKARVVDRNNLAVCKFQPLMQLTQFINEKQINPDQGHFIQIEGVENSTSDYFSLFSLTIFAGIDGQTKP